MLKLSACIFFNVHTYISILLNDSDISAVCTINVNFTLQKYYVFTITWPINFKDFVSAPLQQQDTHLLMNSIFDLSWGISISQLHDFTNIKLNNYYVGLSSFCMLVRSGTSACFHYLQKHWEDDCFYVGSNV